ncbi:MAG: GntR family transcriptional regulator [Hyphomicrobiaceae bacterium]|nr:MAG: GntR family transcriptional regulator [Hyphomicrobiaceae bacterium]
MVRVSTTEDRTRLFWNQYKGVGRHQSLKYIQLRDALTQAIDDGFWSYGDKLPPEGELARLTPFSLGTAQRAYADLVREGMVERRAGAGSYVLRPSKILDTPWHFRFRPHAEAAFRPVFPRIARISHHSGTGFWSSFLRRSSEVVCISRSVRIGSEFTLFAEFYIDAGPFNRAIAARRKVEGVNLRRELSLNIVRMTNDVRVEIFTEKDHPVLKLKEGTSVLIVETRAYAQSSNGNYIQRMIVPPTPEWLHISEFGAGAPVI